MKHKRPAKVEYYLDIAKEVSRRATCLRRRFGAIIVSMSDKIISTGYNGAIRKSKDCLEIGECLRQVLGIRPGERYELCKSFHAEQNAIMGADPTERRGGTLYLYGENADGSVFDAGPCMMCRRTIVQGEIAKVIARQSDGSIKEWVAQDFIEAEDKGLNFPEEMRKTKEFKKYLEKVEKA